jgi:phenylacetic acid degradation operon negative regulatory protein
VRVSVASQRQAAPRRRELGAASAGSLLLTILGEFVLPAGEPVWTSALIRLLGELDVEEKAARQALMRAADAGWIAATREGRRTRWSLTPAGQGLLAEGTRRIFGFAGAMDAAERWDGRWVLLVVSAPEGGRSVRARLRTRLRWAGFGSLPSGVWISPRPEREEEAYRVLAELGLATGAYSFLARPGAVGSAREIAQLAWDLDDVEQHYEDFLDLLDLLRPQTDLERLVCQVRLVQEWRRFPLLDPGLPRELLPPRWSGTRAAEAFRERHERWAPWARAGWARLADDRPRPTG